MGRVRVGALMMVAALAGCGGGVSSPEFDITPGHSVVTPAIQKVTLAQTGVTPGFSTPADCFGAVWSFALSLDTKRLALTCVPRADPSMPATLVSDQALTDQQFETLAAAARAVTVSDRRQCGADLPPRELRVESATAIVVYGDDFYGCLPPYDYFVTYEGLSNLQKALLEIVLPLQ